MLMLLTTPRMYQAEKAHDPLHSALGRPTSTGLISCSMGDRCSVFSPRARVIWRLALALALIAFTALALSGEIGGLQSGALTLLPVIALAVVKLARPYIGEGVIAQMHVRRRRRPCAAALIVVPLRRRGGLARGGRLIAVAMAGRAPPLALAGCL